MLADQPGTRRRPAATRIPVRFAKGFDANIAVSLRKGVCGACVQAMSAVVSLTMAPSPIERQRAVKICVNRPLTKDLSVKIEEKF
jgi:hypothetical protein